MTEWEKAQNGFLYDANYVENVVLIYVMNLIIAGLQILINKENY